MKKSVVFLLFICCSFNIQAQKDDFRKKIIRIATSKNAKVSLAVRGLEDGDTLSFNGQSHCPMQSVFKFHLALAVLDQIDKGKLKLDQKIQINKSDLLPDTWSPLRDKNSDGGQIALRTILGYTVSQSDNNGCDILFKLVGGPKKVNDYIHSLGVKDIAIVATEQEMAKDWNVQFSNWTTAWASVQLLEKTFKKGVLTQTNYDFLWKTMLETTTGSNRIKGLLPKNTAVMHKTGTSGKKNGIMAATNDIGIITLPNGKHVVLAVFVTNSKENDDMNAKLIAEISKATWDYFIAKNIPSISKQKNK
jgi:beta-lactamase class A